MRIWLFSDLHLRHAGIPRSVVLPPVRADLAICAGDLIEGDPEGGVSWLARYVRPQMKVVYIMGNHEFYRPNASMERLKEKAHRLAEQSGIDLLDNGFVDIGDIRIFGSTLWTDFDFFGRGDESRRQRDMAWSELWMNDFRLIRPEENSRELWSATRARREHLISRTWLETAMSDAADRRKVVVTHNAPYRGSVAAKFRNDPLTSAFVSDLSITIEKHQPELWIHGHTHTSFDYRAGTTRVICNPRGYRGENTSGFDPAMVIEI